MLNINRMRDTLTRGAVIATDADGIPAGLVIEYNLPDGHGFTIPAAIIPTPDSLRAFGRLVLAAGHPGWQELTVLDGDVIGAEWVDAATGAVLYLV